MGANSQKILRVTVPGRAQAWKRPYSDKEKKRRTYSEVRKFKRRVKEHVQAEMMRQRIRTLRGAAALRVDFFLDGPNPRTEIVIWESKSEAPTVPDLDNLTKAVWDALTEAKVWGDDCQVELALLAKHQQRKRRKRPKHQTRPGRPVNLVDRVPNKKDR